MGNLCGGNGVRPNLERNLSVPFEGLLSTEAMKQSFRNHFPSSENRVVCLPVVHVPFPDESRTHIKTVSENIDLVLRYKYDGVWLINHGFAAKSLVKVVKEIRAAYPQLWIGANFMAVEKTEIFKFIETHELTDILNGVWVDDVAVHRRNMEEANEILASMQRIGYRGLYFGGVPYSTRRGSIMADDVRESLNDHKPKIQSQARLSAGGYMHVLTACDPASASGSISEEWTIGRLQATREAIGRDVPLAVASGIRPDNVKQYAEIVDCVFVATSISSDFERFDPELVKVMADALGIDYNS